MRTIKFRIWDGSKMWTMEPGANLVLSFISEGIKWGLYDKATEQRYVCDPDGAVHSNTGILMQFTGLLDKNGKEIYENDIIFIRHPYKDRQHTGQVIFQRGKVIITEFFYFPHQDNPNDFIESLEFCEVIGNIHENPDLLK